VASLDERRIQEIVDRVVARLGSVTAAPARSSAAAEPPRSQPSRIPVGRLGSYDSPDSAVAAAQRGFEQNEQAPVELRKRMIAAMRETTKKHVRELAQYAVEETTFGRAEDKVNKNLLVAEKTPGVEILASKSFTGDDGLTLIERAPYGVILAVTPCTNPTETILCNAIGMVAGGNAVVFNVHPAAAKLSAWHVHLLNEARRRAWPPPGGR